MTTLVYKRLGQGIVGTGWPSPQYTTIYTVPTGKVAILRQLALCNFSGGTRVYSVYIVPAGESYGYNKTCLVGRYSMNAPGYHTWAYHFVLTAGAKIIADCDYSTESLNVYASGVEITPPYSGITPTWMIHAELGTSLATLFTVPAGKRAIVKDINITNFGTNDNDVFVDIVRSGSAPGDSTHLIYNYPIAAYSGAHQRRASMMLEAGDTIRAYSDYYNPTLAMNVSGGIIDG